MFLFETFFVCFLIFETELKPARIVDSSLSSRSFLYSEIYDARLTYIYNILFFDGNIILEVLFLEVNLVCFQKWSCLQIVPFPSGRGA